jgi:hypothetical protein
VKWPEQEVSANYIKNEYIILLLKIPRPEGRAVRVRLRAFLYLGISFFIPSSLGSFGEHPKMPNAKPIAKATAAPKRDLNLVIKILLISR